MCAALALHHTDDQHRAGGNQHQNSVQNGAARAGCAGFLRIGIGIDAGGELIFLILFVQRRILERRPDALQAGELEVRRRQLFVREGEGLAVFIQNVRIDIARRAVLSVVDIALAVYLAVCGGIPCVEFDRRVLPAPGIFRIADLLPVGLRQRTLRSGGFVVQHGNGCRTADQQSGGALILVIVEFQILHLLLRGRDAAENLFPTRGGEKGVRHIVTAGVPRRLISLQDSADGVGDVCAHLGVGVCKLDGLAGKLTVQLACKGQLCGGTKRGEIKILRGNENRFLCSEFPAFGEINIITKVGFYGDFQLLRRHVLRIDRLVPAEAVARQIGIGHAGSVALPVLLCFGNKRKIFVHPGRDQLRQPAVEGLIYAPTLLLLKGFRIRRFGRPYKPNGDILADLRQRADGKLILHEENLVLRLRQAAFEQPEVSESHRLRRHHTG